jgi:HAD superfamily hydrolase (TIGR01549 family)
MAVRAMAFDLDGTLIKTNVRFSEYRRRLGNIQGDILEYIKTTDEATQQRLFGVIDDYEHAIQKDCTLTEGVLEVIDYLQTNDIKMGIITRSTQQHAHRIIEKLNIPISLAIGRDTITPKPSGDALRLLSNLLKVPLDQMLFVGDYIWDILAGKDAGVKTVLYLNHNLPDFTCRPDYMVTHFTHLIELIKNLNLQ